MKAIRNTLFSLTLLASVLALYCPKTLAMGGKDQQGSGGHMPESGQEQQEDHVQPEETGKVDSPENDDLVSAKNGDEDDKISGDDKGDKKGDSKDGNKEPTKTTKKGFISTLGGLVLLPLNAVDWIATPITSLFGTVGGWGLWKERYIGKWLTNRKTGLGRLLGRLVVIAAVSSAGYYVWNKSQEWKKQNEEEDNNFDINRLFFDENEEDADVTFPENAQ